MTRATRRERLRHALDAHRIAAHAAMQIVIRQARDDRFADVGDTLEQTDASNQSELEFALVQLRAETLRRINEALVRLDAGQYGSCVECEEEIAEARIRALPFAVRCRNCAELHEQRSREARPSAAPGLERLSPFAPVVGP